MNGKLLIVLAILLIIISCFGIIQQSKTKAAPTKQTISKEVTILLASKEIKKGEVLSYENMKLGKKSLGVDDLKDSFVIDRPIDDFVGLSSYANIAPNTPIRYEDILSHLKKDDSLSISQEGDLPFSFPLLSREFETIRHLHKGEFVDIYFRYEKKTKNSEDGIVTKNNQDSIRQSKENANVANFVLMFKQKRVLNIKEKSSPNAAGTIVLQMHPDEIKSVYAIENLGYFYMFPSSLHDNVASISTKRILANDFIKELRGGEE